MMNYTFADAEMRRQFRLVQKLAADLELLRLGIGPLADELASAPRIDNWQFAARAEVALQGEISGHPLISGPAVTSGLYLLDKERGFARTLSRFYTLGREARS